MKKSSRRSKSGEQIQALQRRLDLGNSGDIKELIPKATTIQNRLNKINISKGIAELVKSFLILMEIDNVNRALELLTSKWNSPIRCQYITVPSWKTSSSKNADDEVLMPEKKSWVHPVIYQSIDEDLVKRAVLVTKGGSEPPGFAPNSWT